MPPSPSPSPPPPTGADIAVASAAPPPRLYGDAYLSIFRYLDLRTLGAVAAAHRSLFHAPLTRLTEPRVTIATRRWGEARVEAAWQAAAAGGSSNASIASPAAANSPLPSPRSPLRHLVDGLNAAGYLAQLESVCAPLTLADRLPQLTQLEFGFFRHDANQFVQKMLASEQAVESTAESESALVSSAAASAAPAASPSPSSAATASATASPSSSSPPAAAPFFFSLPPSLHTLRIGWSDVYGNGEILTAAAVALEVRALATLASRLPSLTDLSLTGASDVGTSAGIFYSQHASVPPMLEPLRALTKLERLEFELRDYDASEPTTRCMAKEDMDTILRLPSLTQLELMGGRLEIEAGGFIDRLLHSTADIEDDAYDECASAAASLRSRLRFLLFAPEGMPDVTDAQRAAMAELKARCPQLTNLN